MHSLLGSKGCSIAQKPKGPSTSLSDARQQVLHTSRAQLIVRHVSAAAAPIANTLDAASVNSQQTTVGARNPEPPMTPHQSNSSSSSQEAAQAVKTAKKAKIDAAGLTASIKRTTNWQQLASLFESKSGRLNEIHIAAIWSRLPAVLPAADVNVVHSSTTSPTCAITLPGFLHALEADTLAQVSSSGPRALASVVWGMAKVFLCLRRSPSGRSNSGSSNVSTSSRSASSGVSARRSVGGAGTHAGSSTNAVQAEDASATVSGGRPEPWTGPGRDFLKAWGDRAAAVSTAFSTQDVSLSVWALGVLRCNEHKPLSLALGPGNSTGVALRQALLAATARVLPQADHAQQVSNIAVGLARLRYNPSAQFLEQLQSTALQLLLPMNGSPDSMGHSSSSNSAGSSSSSGRHAHPNVLAICSFVWGLASLAGASSKGSDEDSLPQLPALLQLAEAAVLWTPPSPRAPRMDRRSPADIAAAGGATGSSGSGSGGVAQAAIGSPAAASAVSATPQQPELTSASPAEVRDVLWALAHVRARSNAALRAALPAWSAAALPAADASVAASIAGSMAALRLPVTAEWRKVLHARIAALDRSQLHPVLVARLLHALAQLGSKHVPKATAASLWGHVRRNLASYSTRDLAMVLAALEAATRAERLAAAAVADERTDVGSSVVEDPTSQAVGADAGVGDVRDTLSTSDDEADPAVAAVGGTGSEAATTATGAAAAGMAAAKAGDEIAAAAPAPSSSSSSSTKSAYISTADPSGNMSHSLQSKAEEPVDSSSNLGVQAQKRLVSLWSPTTELPLRALAKRWTQVPEEELETSVSLHHSEVVADYLEFALAQGWLA